MEFVKIEVDKVFPIADILEKLVDGDGGASLNYNVEEKTLSLYVAIPNPTFEEIDSFRNQEIRFALYSNPVLDTSIIIAHLGTQLVFDLLYDINFVKGGVDGRVDGNRFDIFLIDSTTGILKALRVLGLGKNFMKEINRITKNDTRYTTKQYNEWLNQDVFTKGILQLWKESKKVNWDE
jgi:hypothetical protein